MGCSPMTISIEHGEILKFLTSSTSSSQGILQKKKITVASAFLLKWVFQTLALGFLKPKTLHGAVAQPRDLSQVPSGDLKSVGTEAKFFKRATTHG